MQPLPHRYEATATASAEGRVVLGHAGVPPIESEGPVEFGGPGDVWSPEGLLVAAIADCFILTFRAVARARKLAWSGLDVRVEGTLERRDGVTAFTGFQLYATLGVDPGTDVALATAALERAERGCLVSASLKGPVHLHPEVVERG